MEHGHVVSEATLASLAKQARTEAGVTQAKAARQLGVSQGNIAYAENDPRRSLTKLRKAMIALYAGGYEVRGPYFVIARKTDKLDDMYF